MLHDFSTFFSRMTSFAQNFPSLITQIFHIQLKLAMDNVQVLTFLTPFLKSMIFIYMFSFVQNFQYLTWQVQFKLAMDTFQFCSPQPPF